MPNNRCDFSAWVLTMTRVFPTRLLADLTEGSEVSLLRSSCVKRARSLHRRMQMSSEMRAQINASLFSGMQPLEVARKFGLSLLSLAEVIVPLPPRHPISMTRDFDLSSLGREGSSSGWVTMRGVAVRKTRCSTQLAGKAAPAWRGE
jgi:hypothetical protein